jgi:hypothetical protein
MSCERDCSVFPPWNQDWSACNASGRGAVKPDASTAKPRALCAYAGKAQAVAASLVARSAESCGMPCDPYIREKFTRDLSFARQLAKEYFQRFPKDRYETEVESWRQIQSFNIKFVMKRLREPQQP